MTQSHITPCPDVLPAPAPSAAAAVTRLPLYMLWKDSRDGRILLGVFSEPELAMAHRPGAWYQVEGVYRTWYRPGKRRADRFEIHYGRLDEGLCR